MERPLSTFEKKNKSLLHNTQVSVSVSGFGTSTSGGGLFGSTNTTSNPFGGTTSLFGGSGFSANQQPGTTVKFNVSSYDVGNLAVESAMEHVFGI